MGLVGGFHDHPRYHHGAVERGSENIVAAEQSQRLWVTHLVRIAASKSKVGRYCAARSDGCVASGVTSMRMNGYSGRLDRMPCSSSFEATSKTLKLL